jgi:hypothetical protein
MRNEIVAMLFFILGAINIVSGLTHKSYLICLITAFFLLASTFFVYNDIDESKTAVENHEKEMDDEKEAELEEERKRIKRRLDAKQKMEDRKRKYGTM